MEKDLISIIIPIYKVEKYLEKCVKSVINQTYQNLEIILVDDGSPDNCPKICDELAKTDARIKVVHKINGGLSDARNAGIEVAAGDYLMFLDSDDYIDRTMCSRLYELLLEYNADFSMCDACRFKEEETPNNHVDNVQIRVYEDRDVCRQLLKADSTYLVIASAKLYKAELFKDLRYAVGKLHEDVHMLHKILGETNRFVYTNEQMYFYLQRDGSIMSRFTEKNYQHIYEAYINRYEFFNTRTDKFSEYDNNVHALGNLRNLYTNAKNEKFDIQHKIFEKYNEIYKKTKKKPLREIIFRRFFWIYKILLKIKGQ